MADTVIVVKDETVVTIETAQQGPQGPPGADGATGATGPPADSGVITLASGATCDLDISSDNRVFIFTANQDFSISVSNLPVSDAWGVVLMLTNAGAYTVTYPAAWMEAGGTALSFTVAGTDRVVITGEGNDETTVIISVVSEDVK